MVDPVSTAIHKIKIRVQGARLNPTTLVTRDGCNYKKYNLK